MKEPTFVFPFVSILIMRSFGGPLSGFAPTILYMNKIIIQTGVPGDPYWIGAGLQIYRLVLSFPGSWIMHCFPRKILISVTCGIVILGDLTLGLSVQYNLSEWFGIDFGGLQYLPIIGMGLLYLAAGLGHFNLIFRSIH